VDFVPWFKTQGMWFLQILTSKTKSGLYLFRLSNYLTFLLIYKRYINSRQEKRYARKKNENLSPEILVLEANDIVFFYQHVLHFGMGYQQLVF
jgi:hypothetical protein